MKVSLMTLEAIPLVFTPETDSVDHLTAIFFLLFFYSDLLLFCGLPRERSPKRIRGLRQCDSESCLKMLVKVVAVLSFLKKAVSLDAVPKRIDMRCHSPFLWPGFLLLDGGREAVAQLWLLEGRRAPNTCVRSIDEVEVNGGSWSRWAHYFKL